MLNSPPRLYLSASGQDRPFVDSLCARLRSRGLAVREGGDLGETATRDERQREIDTCQAVLVVISRASMRSAEVTADYQYALAHTQQIFPVIVSTANDLPADLSHLQAIDFSAGEEAGWAELLIALDTLGIARYPIASPPDLDDEVVLARARSGITPPAWYVTRLPVQSGRRLTRWTIYGVAITVILTILTYFATGRNLLVLAPALYIVYQLYIKYSPAGLRALKNSPMVILTPDGFVVTTKTGSAVSAAFRDATTDVPPAQARTSDIHLKVDPRNGRPFVEMTLSAFPGEGILGKQALAHYQAYVARYLSDEPDQAPVATVAAAPLLFISYSRKDASVIDRLELSLRQAGYNIWVDRSNLHAGQSWSAQVGQAIDQCAALVVALSPAALRSAAVRNEYQHALKAGKPVLIAAIRTTRQPPPELRQAPRSDLQGNLMLGVLSLTEALDQAGAHPASMFGALPGGRLPRSSTLVMARALHGITPPDGTVYRASLPARFTYSTIILLAVAAAGVLFALAIRDLYPLFIAGVLLFGIGVPNLLLTRRRLRYPDTIVTLPEGYITFFNSARLSEHPYDSLSTVTITASDAFSGVMLANSGVGSSKPYTVQIRPGFHQSRHIAERIIADFNHYKRAI
ncbi:MAG TPA: toll/interleukin-1 receptor domain-containing protein [Ktedonobacterales bacterium]|nr:toll/interleukin-1 receptor domain-containing protein [Ktedonobacterales bacterium]